ncbi:hypothetical protein DIPPA_27961 [Diplonema papillatum]|nr:hypothetical protein DIPPA_27961 [Diplonema papillatum]
MQLNLPKTALWLRNENALLRYCKTFACVLLSTARNRKERRRQLAEETVLLRHAAALKGDNQVCLFDP